MNQTQIEDALYQWLSKNIGDPHVFTITFDADLITGNTINATVNGDAITAVPFDTDHDTTIAALATALQATNGLVKAKVTAARQITCTGLIPGQTVTIVGPTVTGGASQAVASVATTSAPVFVQVIFADSTESRPDKPYCVIRLESGVQIGWDELRNVDPDTCLSQIGGQRRMTVALDYIGEKPVERMYQAANSLEKVSVQQQLYAEGIAVGDKNDVQNLTRFLETETEHRSRFDFFIYYNDSVEDELGVIETIDVDGGTFTSG